MIESTVCEFVCQPKLDRMFFGYDIKEQVYHVMIAAKVFLMSCTSGDRHPNFKIDVHLTLFRLK